jgi:arginine decarboxylase
MPLESSESWTLAKAAELYNLPNWGKGYFAINRQGNVAVHPRKDPDESIDLKELVDGILRRGIELPALIRFDDILKHRILEMNSAFHDAIEDYGYRGTYRAVYPVKVNQQRHVVEEFLQTGRPLDFGLECGSKPELVATLALTHRSHTLIICNGFKDDDYIKMVLFAQKMGKSIIPVIEKFSELRLIVKHAKKLNVRPIFGIRVKPSSPGAGRWRASAGERSKFGLTVTELLDCVSLLDKYEMRDGFQLLHFHLGSQITNIHNVKDAISEVSRIYVELVKFCPGLKLLDVGGGLGVDYDGSQTNFESSMNYTLREYARDVIFRVQSACDEGGVEHPTIITEAGRATVAFHSVLVFDTLDVSTPTQSSQVPDTLPKDSPVALIDLHEICHDVTKKNLLESYHDAVQAYEELLNLFKLGHLSLERRSLAERLYYTAVHRILRLVRTLDYVPDELAGLEIQLADTYFCNFSIFHSLPDSWAIKQLFPIMPIHRLRERPTRRGVLADITCDSDGKIDRFIDLRDVKKSLELHSFKGESYFLAAFLVGAYQEILGDLHNLFGDTNVVHVRLDENGMVDVENVVKGETVAEVLSFVEYNPAELLAQVRRDVELALRRGLITLDESAGFLRFYESSLGAYTYLTSRHRRANAANAAASIIKHEKDSESESAEATTAQPG